MRTLRHSSGDVMKSLQVTLNRTHKQWVITSHRYYQLCWPYIVTVPGSQVCVSTYCRWVVCQPDLWTSGSPHCVNVACV